MPRSVFLARTCHALDDNSQFFFPLLDFPRIFIYLYIYRYMYNCKERRLHESPKKKRITQATIGICSSFSLFVRFLTFYLSVLFFPQSTTMFCLRISSSTITPDINTSRLFYRRMLSQFKWLLQSRIILRFVRFCCCCCHSSLRCRCPFVARALEFIYSQFFPCFWSACLFLLF